MTTETSAPAGDGAPAPVASTPAPTAPVATSELTVSEAARLLAQRRNKPAPVEQPMADPVEQPELAQANDDPETAPIEEPDATEPEEAPPIEPPRSWTKDRKEQFNALPRDLQVYVADRVQEQDREFRTRQNDFAEKLKGLTTKEQQAEQLRQQYEAKLPQVMQVIQETGPFSDIRSMADVEKLQAEDPFRFQAYQVHQWKLQAVQADLMEAESRRAQEHQSSWAQHVQKENELAAEHIPELADKDKAEKLVSRVAKELLPELGFKDSELNDLASGKQRLSIYDHRVQRLLADSLKLRDIQKAPRAVATKAVPSVQRPGTAKAVNTGAAQQIQALQKQLTGATGNQAAEIAADLLRLKRAARR